jgi:hypothetical protein
MPVANKSNTDFSSSAQDNANPAAANPEPAESDGVNHAADKKSHESVQIVHKPISAKKIAANQKNGAKAKGPTTASGKFYSSWNSTRHGLLSKRLMKLNDEKAKQFSAVLKSLRQDLEPRAPSKKFW